MASSTAIRAGAAFVELTADDSKLIKGLKSARAGLQSFGAGMARIGTTAAAAGGAILAGFVPAIQAASRMQETMNKFNVVFGESAADVKQWGDDFAAQVGRSKEQIASFMAGAQDLFVPLGFEPGAAQGMSKQIAGLALDLASFNNMADADVMRDLQAALTGSGEVMKKYGVILSEAAVKQELLNMGMDPAAASNQEKVLARLNIILAGTTAAQGDAIRSGGSFANQTKALRAKLDDLAVTLGQAVLPTITELIARGSEWIDRAANWIEQHQGLALTAAKVGVALVAVGTAFGAIGGAAAIAANLVGTATTALKGLNVAVAFLVANPAVAVVLALSAAAIALGYALQKASRHTAETSTELSKLRAEADAARQADLGRLERLQQLADAEKLNSREMAEARDLIAGLQSTYGDLGLTLDETTGKIHGMAGAWDKARAAMAEAAEAEIKAEITERRGNIAERIAETKSIGGGILGTGASFTPWADQARLDTLERQNKADLAHIDALNQRLAALRGGSQAALAGGQPAAAGAPAALDLGDVEDLQDPEARARYEERLARELADLKISLIEDEEERELARIKTKYDRDRAEAEKLGADIAALNEAEALETDALRRRLAHERAAELGARVETVDLGAAAQAAAATTTRAAGTFSAEAAATFGRGAGVQDRIAKATEKTADNTGRLIDKIANAGLAWTA